MSDMKHPIFGTEIDMGTVAAVSKELVLHAERSGCTPAEAVKAWTDFFKTLNPAKEPVLFSVFGGILAACAAATQEVPEAMLETSEGTQLLNELFGSDKRGTYN